MPPLLIFVLLETMK